MLGKTNINTLREGAIVTEIEDYKWIQAQTGIYGNFVRAIYKNNYLVTITADGTVVYTMDGEVWQTRTLEYADCKLNDIEWDGSKFVIAGTQANLESTSSNGTKGLLITSEDLTTFSEIEEVESLYGCREIYCLFYVNGKFILVIDTKFNSETKTEVMITDLTKDGTRSPTVLYPSTAETISIGKNTNGILVFANKHLRAGYNGDFSSISFISLDNITVVKEYAKMNVIFKTSAVFECKNILYVMGLHETTTGYALEKLTDSVELMTMCTGQNFMFVDGVYYNESQLFINNHEMLIVKKGENIADKTIDDLIEIAPEITMNCITKAFGQLYIFGNQGVVLKSSAETNNEDSILVQTLSAKKALEDAKAYTDMKINELKELLNIEG